MMKALHTSNASHAVKRKVLSSSGEESSSPNKRNHAGVRSSSGNFPPPTLSPASVTITTSNGEKIELVGEPPEARSPYNDYGYVEESTSGPLSLLPCRVRRNYACKLCDFTSINPRQFLYHQRDSHGQKGNIHECSYCMYASVHSHKLLRHISLVHRQAAANAVEDHEQLRTPAGYLASTPPTSVSAVVSQNLTSTGGTAASTPSSSSYRSLSGEGVPLPPDLEVILVEEEDSTQTQNGPGSRKSVRPMLLEPSVVLLPVDKQKNYNNNNHNINNNNNNNNNGVGPYDKAQRPPPPLLHRQNIRPPLQASSFQSTSLPPPPRLASIRPTDPRVSNPAAATAFLPQRAKVVQEFSCSKCTFKSKSRVLVQRHEKVSHLKKKFFRCSKCNYVTNVRARFTKHVRYHDMPYIKCELCDFSTPYKWNLDRHRRNHQEEGALMGAAPEGVEVFRCHRCSFSTLSKQSLSVHLLNHHAEGGGQRRPRKMDENGQELLSSDSFATGEEDDYGDFEHENGFMDMVEGEDEEEEEIDDDDVDDEGEEDMEDLEALEEGDVHASEDEAQYGDDDEGLPEDLDGSSKPYACAECRESFASVSHLDRHVYECHEVDRPKGGPSEGQRTPTPKKPEDGKPKFKCDLCPYQAKWISEVVRHRRVHVSDKPFACPHCYFRSKWKGDMTRHVSKYHGELTPGMSMRSRDDDALSTVKSSAMGEEQDTEVDDIDQLLDQSMMVGGEEELQLFDERNNNNNSSSSAAYNHNRQQQRHRHVEHQDGPLDLSRPVGSGYDYLTKELLQKYNKERDGATGLLPYLLKMPPRQSFTQSRMATAPIHLSPSVQLIPTSGSVLGPSSVGSGMQTIVTSAPISTTTVPSTTTLHTTTSPSNRNDQTTCETLSSSDPSVKSADRTGSSPLVRKLYQCPYCKYSTTTASRFHMHVVVHLNQKPYMCSECGYRSNWQWDVTKHAKVKASRDPAHKRATVVLVNEVGAKNYEKYEKYAVYETMSKNGRRSYTSQAPTGSTIRSVEHEELESMFGDHGMPSASPRRPALPSHQRSKLAKKITYKCKYCEFRNSARRTIIRHMSVHSSNKPFWCGICGQSSNCRNVILRHCQVRHGVPGPIMHRDEEAENPPLPSAPGINGDLGFEVEEESMDGISRKSSSALVQCLTGSPQLLSPSANSAEGAETEASSVSGASLDAKEDKNKRHKCSICPYRCRKLFDLRIHSYMHKPHEGAIFKCMFCPFYVSLKRSWLQHMKLHVDQPQEFARQYLENGADFEMDDKKGDTVVSQAAAGNAPASTSDDGAKSPAAESDHPVVAPSVLEVSRMRPPRPKRYVCEQCPYKTGSHTTYLYHRQFHRPGRVGVHRCTYCSYSVTRPHLLGQHIRMHEAYDAEVKERKEGAKDGSPESPSSVSQATTTHPASSQSPTSQQVSPRSSVANLPDVNSVNGTSAVVSTPAVCSPPHHQFSLDRGSPPPPGDDLPYELAGLSRVWVNRNGVFLKMFRCRHCPHVSKKRAVIIAHERLHYKRKMTAGKQIFKCQLCNYTCKNAGILSSHQKVHREEQSMVMIGDDVMSSGGPPGSVSSRAVIDVAAGSSPQLGPAKFQTRLSRNADAVSSPTSNVTSRPVVAPEDSQESDDKWIKPSSTRFPNKLYSSCGLCPAKFMKPHQVALHRTFHGANLAWQCQYCSYSARHRPHLHNHMRVHTDEYQKEFKRDLGSGASGTMDKQDGESVESRFKSPEAVAAATNDSTLCSASPSSLPANQTPTSAIVSQAKLPTRTPGSHQGERKHRCHLCPAVFIKYSTLVYHLHLHGSNSKFKCPHCSYSVTNIGNLVRHVKVHDVNGKSLDLNTTNVCGNVSASPSSECGGGAKLQGIFACPKCPATFDKQLRYDNHLGLHGSKQRFQCDRCDYSVQYAANLVRHRRMHAAHEANQRAAAAKPQSETSVASMALATASNSSSATTVNTIADSFTTTSITNSYALNGGTVVEASSSNASAALFEDGIVTGTSSSSSGIKSVVSSCKSVSDLLGETLNSMEGANITPVEKQQLLLQRLQSFQCKNQMASPARNGPSTRVTPPPPAPLETEQPSEPKKLFRCGRCPYTHPRKDAVQSHMRRHAISDSTCPHCDYGSSLTSFLREHIKLHFKPLRIHQVEAFVQWEEFEVWAKYGDLRRLIYRYSVDGKEFTEDDVYEVTNEEFLAKQKMRNGSSGGGTDAALGGGGGGEGDGEPEITIIRQKDVDLRPTETAAIQPDSHQQESSEEKLDEQSGAPQTLDKEEEEECSKKEEKMDVEDSERSNASRDPVAGGELSGQFEEGKSEEADDEVTPLLNNVIDAGTEQGFRLGTCCNSQEETLEVTDDDVPEEMEVGIIDRCPESVERNDQDVNDEESNAAPRVGDDDDDEKSMSSSDIVTQVVKDLIDVVEEYQSRGDDDIQEDDDASCKVSIEAEDGFAASMEEMEEEKEEEEDDDDDDADSYLGEKWIVLDEQMDDDDDDHDDHEEGERGEEQEEHLSMEEALTQTPSKEDGPEDLPNGFEQDHSTLSPTINLVNCASQSSLNRDSSIAEFGDGVGSLLKVPATDVSLTVDAE